MTKVAPDELVTAADVARMLGVSRQRVRELERRADFPVSVGTVARSKVWRKSEIEAWASTWDRRVGRPRTREDQAPARPAARRKGRAA